MEQTLKGVYVLSLRIGSTELEDTVSGVLLHPNKQVKIACDIVAEDPHLSNGFNAIGFSQGAQFL